MKLYLDLDGVLANFTTRMEKVFPVYWIFKERYGKEKVWDEVFKRDSDFFYFLQPMDDMDELIEETKQFNPTVLTGVPDFRAYGQKKRWMNLFLPHVPLIMCEAKHKHLVCSPGDIIIDDRTKYKKEWENAGGTFIVYTSAKSSLEQLLSLQ